MDDDPVFGELIESLKHCRERIRKQMKNENFVVTSVTWELIWAEMRNSWKVSSRVKKQLKCWFQLWKDFPTEMAREYEPSSLSSSHTKDELYIVQPGDLWMDCGSPHLPESLTRTKESSTVSIDSVLQSKQGPPQCERVKHEEKNESSASSTSDNAGLDVHKTTGEYDDFPLLKTKPWWIGMLASPAQSSQVKAASPPCSSPKPSLQETVTGQRSRDTNSPKQVECKPEQRSSISNTKKELTESSYFFHRSKVLYRTGTKKIKERSDQGREIEPIEQRGSSRRFGKSVHTRTREPKLRPVQDRKPKTRTKPEISLSDEAPKLSSFPPKGYVYEKGDWVVHSIMSSVSTPEDLTVALRERGYELKHIIKRECTLPQKWICSLIASADRTHIITSENIWLKGWEVDFVCDEEDISPFLLE